MMQWFRMWTDAIDDEKLKLLAFEDRWHYVALLCMKRKGILDAPDSPALRDRKVGAKLGLGDRDRDEVRNRLREVGLVDENWQPLGWGKRQFVSDADPTATQRKRNQRDRQRHERVTRDRRDSHGGVTLKSRSSHATQTQISDSDTDSEKNQRGSRAPKRARSRTVPADFEVTEGMRSWAREACPAVDIDAETVKFRDHEFRDPHGNWPAAWRTWMRRSVEFRRSGASKPTHTPAPTTAELEAREAARAGR